MWRKVLLALLLVALCLVLIAGVLWSQRTRLLSHYLSACLGNPVTVTNMKLSWHKMKLYGVTIRSPPGSVIHEALFAEQVKLPISPLRFLRNRVDTPAFVIQHAVLGIEFFDKEGTKTNWNQILANMRGRRGPLFAFETTVFDHLTLSCYSYPLEQRVPTIPYHRLELRPKEDGTALPFSDAMKAIFQTALEEVSGQPSLPDGMERAFEGPTPYQVFLRFLEP